MRTADEDLEATARKVKRLFLIGVERAAGDGTCTDDLWLLFKSMGLLLKADVQELEGVNSMIKSICQRCPNLTLPVLDARLRLKKALGFGGRWMATPTTPISTLAECAGHFAEAALRSGLRETCRKHRSALLLVRILVGGSSANDGFSRAPRPHLRRRDRLRGGRCQVGEVAPHHGSIGMLAQHSPESLQATSF